MIRRPALTVLLGFVMACGPQPTTAAGFVVALDSPTLTKVDSFTLRTEDGTELTFTVGAVELDNGAFPPGHLREHMALGQPVAVAYREEAGERVVFRLADAPWLAP